MSDRHSQRARNLVSKLNARLVSEFGEIDGWARYKWVHTASEEFWIRDGEVWSDGSFHGHRDLVAMPSGVIATLPVFKKGSWVEMYGPRYVVAALTPPLSEAQHERIFGPKVPWAKHGQYQPIETFLLNPGKLPSEDGTSLVISVIRQNIGMDEEDYRREGEEIHEKTTAETLTRIGDEMDDMVDAPSLRVGKGSVSFPSIVSSKAPLIVVPN